MERAQQAMVNFREAITNMDTSHGELNNPVNELGNFQMEEPHVTDHQPEEQEPFFDPHDVQYDEEDEEEDSSSDHFVPTEAEKDAASRIVKLKQPAAKQPAKRPRSPEVVDDDVPNLPEIFDNYDTPKAQRISICRAYASFLASTMPKKPKKAAKKVSRK